MGTIKCFVVVVVVVVVATNLHIRDYSNVERNGVRYRVNTTPIEKTINKMRLRETDGNGVTIPDR